MVDLGLTHVALPVSNLNDSIAFYTTYARMQVGVVYSWGRAGIAADIRYTFGTPWSCSKRRPMPNAMPQRQHTR